MKGIKPDEIIWITNHEYNMKHENKNVGVQ